MNDSRPGIVVVVSGSGTNLQAIVDAVESGDIRADIRSVISNRADAWGLERARRHGITAEHVGAARNESRADYDRRLGARLRHYEPSLVVLAGFMRILGPDLVGNWAGRMINIHPSLLPAYKGLDTHARALADGVSRHGATVHYVTPELDSGPGLIQGDVPVLADDDVERLSARVHAAEHIIYPAAVRWITAGRAKLRGDGVELDGERLQQPFRVTFDANMQPDNLV